MPSEEMGDYVEYKKKKVQKTGPLYPLDEEVFVDLMLSKY